MVDKIPEMQWSLTCPSEGKIQVTKIPVPKPLKGDVLVKCFAAPINPSDLGMMSGVYSKNKLFDIPYPTQPGWEGAGIVVGSGGGMMAW
jgi:NADPH:quinone reductase-like Zn-dependent oxidoreductase